ncbi:MAG TPA: UrcA family protein [Allosphingosinicella sp.]|nr:UrcA family protein [Allosphingosinicella sp.]
MNKFLISATLISVATLSSPALAEPGSTAPSVTVQHRDLDLTTLAGRATLRTRVNAAARKVCQIRFDGGVAELLGRSSCPREAAAAGNEQANMIIARANRTGEGLLAAR